MIENMEESKLNSEESKLKSEKIWIWKKSKLK